MTKTWYITKRQFKPDNPAYGERPHGPSMTVPGETKSIGELLERYQKGGTLPFREPVYLDSEDVDFINQYYAPHALDLTDLDALDRHTERLKESVEQAKANRAAERLAEQRKAEELLERQNRQKPEAGKQTPAES